MANIKGITIDIGGNTSKLEDALKNVNKVVYYTNNELKRSKKHRITVTKTRCIKK